MNNTKKVALCGVVCALALTMMLITSVFPFGTFALPCFAGMLFTVIVVEYGFKTGLTCYVIVAIMSLFLVTDKEAALYFALFFGFYPVIKSLLERLKNKVLQYVTKYLIFNLCVISAFFIAKFVLMIPDGEFEIFGIYMPWMFLVIGNAFFIVYDVCVSVVVNKYVFTLRDKFIKNK